MSVSIRPFEPSDMAVIRPVHDLGSESILTERYGLFLKQSGPAFTAWVDGEPAGAAGLVLIWPGVASAWAVLGREIIAHPMTLHRKIVHGIGMLREEHNLHRIQADVSEDNATAIRWIRRLGFAYEGRMPGYGPNGENYERYAITWLL